MTHKALYQQALDALKFAYNDCESDYVRDQKIDPAINKLEAAIAEPEPQPVGVVDALHRVWLFEGQTLADGAKVYAAPVQPVPLTDEQINEIGVQTGVIGESFWSESHIEFAHAIERAVLAARDAK